jgi:hypothetical protein
MARREFLTAITASGCLGRSEVIVRLMIVSFEWMDPSGCLISNSLQHPARRKRICVEG